jgi:cobyrinic acid a,c-diamide synthase
MIPRIVIAGTGPGSGKTTVACGLIAALNGRGMTVQPIRIGPDTIDPDYHALAAGRTARNLDPLLSGSELMVPLLQHGCANADIAVIDGVMGLFDDARGYAATASTADIAKLTGSPVLLVIDGSASSRSVAAVIHGFRTFDPAVRLVGIILNRVRSDDHERDLRAAVSLVPGPRLPVLGAIGEDDRYAITGSDLDPWPDRRCEPRLALGHLSCAVTSVIDLAAVVALARSAAGTELAAHNPPVDDLVAADSLLLAEPDEPTLTERALAPDRDATPDAGPMRVDVGPATYTRVSTYRRAATATSV